MPAIHRAQNVLFNVLKNVESDDFLLDDGGQSVYKKEEYVPAPTLFGISSVTDHIVAILNDRDEVDEAMARLRGAGFSDDDVLQVSGDEVINRYQQALKRRSVIEQLGERFAEALDTYEVDLARHYIAAARRGSYFLVIYAPDEDRIEKARAGLSGKRKVDMHHYGQWAITNLS